jgi:hypothetical protein
MNNLILIGDSVLINPTAIAHVQRFSDGTVNITFLGNTDSRVTVTGSEAEKLWLLLHPYPEAERVRARQKSER